MRNRVLCVKISVQCCFMSIRTITVLGTWSEDLLYNPSFCPGVGYCGCRNVGMLC